MHENPYPYPLPNLFAAAVLVVDVVLTLLTVTGLRTVAVCDRHDDMTASELVRYSTAIDEGQQQLEAEIFLASLDARFRAGDR